MISKSEKDAEAITELHQAIIQVHQLLEQIRKGGLSSLPQSNCSTSVGLSDDFLSSIKKSAKQGVKIP